MLETRFNSAVIISSYEFSKAIMNGSVPSSVQSTSSISKVDRRRRDNINDKIQQLLTIIPPELFQDYYRNGNDSETSLAETPGGSTPKAGSIAMKMKSTGTKDGKPNKGQILTQSVEYINCLQNQVDTKNREEVELIFKVQELCRKTGTIINDINLENTSAEVALAKIGVGPLASDYSEQNNNPGSPSPEAHSSSSAHPQTSAPRSSRQPSGFEYGGYTEYS